jgi:D-beta-D-heptose 7-phosphate kinase/D-beta-D-heptose 1-phosphate adenosyltransferase
LTENQEKTLLQAIKDNMPQSDIVLLSDYAKGLLTASVTQKIIALAHQFNKKVLIDPKGNDYSKYKGAFLVKPNRKELEAVSGQSLDPSSENFLKDVASAARYVLKKNSIENMVVTLSEKGMLYVSSDASEAEIYLPTFAREVFDVSGAGDTSLATLGAALAAGAKIGQAMELANIASGIVVAKVGTATVSVDEIQEQLK